MSGPERGVDDLPQPEGEGPADSARGDALGAGLQARADRTHLSEADRVRIIAAATSDRRAGRSSVASRPLAWAAVLALLLAGATTLVVLTPRFVPIRSPVASMEASHAAGSTSAPASAAASAVPGTAAPRTAGTATAGPATEAPATRGPTPTATPGPDARVLLYAEFDELVKQVHTDGIERTVIADMEIDRGARGPDRPDCGPRGGCSAGAYVAFDGSQTPVYTDSVTLPSLGKADAPLSAEFAVRIEPTALDVLGFASLTPDDYQVIWPADRAALPRAGGLVAVDGWLTALDSPCGESSPPPSPGDAPGRCVVSYVTKDPIVVHGVPDEAIEVQPSAYDEYAAASAGAVDPSGTSKRAVYVLRSSFAAMPECQPPPDQNAPPPTPLPRDCIDWNVVGVLTSAGLPRLGHPPSTGPGPYLGEMTVLDAHALSDVIASVRSGTVPTRDVLTDAFIDTTRRPDSLVRTCGRYPQPCVVIGTVPELGDVDGVVVQVDDPGSGLSGPTEGASVILRVDADAPLQYLGTVGTGEPPAAISVQEAIEREPTLPLGSVVVVGGYLEGMEEFTCGPALEPASPMPRPPFDCGVHDYITPDPEQLVFPYGTNGSQGRKPDVGLEVQYGAAREFPGVGEFVVQVVVDEYPMGCGCRGWLVVGHVDPVPDPSALDVANSERPLTQWELLEASQEASRDGVGRTVVADVTVDTDGMPASPVEDQGLRQIGVVRLKGEPEPLTVWATPALARELVTHTEGARPLLAFRIHKDGTVELLGHVDATAGVTTAFGSGDLAPRVLDGLPVSTLIAVQGWLVDTENVVECPAPAPPPVGPPPNTPFESCPWAWITPDETQPVQASNGGWTIVPPTSGIAVQPEAYQDFARDPVTGTSPDSMASEPRLGTYLLRLVEDPRPGAKPKRGWQVTSRLDPSP